MNREQVLQYLDDYGKEEEDLVIMPRRYLELLERKDIGRSARAMLRSLAGIDVTNSTVLTHPMDASEMLRCLQLVRDFPELRERLPQMAEVSTEWAIIVSHWEELEDAWTNGRRLVVGGPSDLYIAFCKVRGEIDKLWR